MLSIKNILYNCQFWQDVEQLEIILALAKRAIQTVEANSSNMALCFLELVKMAIAIKNIPDNIDLNFKNLCIKIYNNFDLSNKENESNLNNLLIAELMDLNFYDNNETEIENNSFLDNQYLLENNENSDIDLEAILNKELQN
ncbi:17953_t:CDS:2 [Dentiscutata erythropus]|uniref:17953_t:CDS:1 n=1 Tax=Dentiscutata erythropus TaxID=1348616 RepID=A0A9N9P9A0_9GLOM|nr:17953_t:CDS:2 [Dentiscutata erythropus]